MRRVCVVVDSLISVACEQALCLGKNSEEREGKHLHFLSPPRSTKGLFTGYISAEKVCDCVIFARAW